MLKEAGVARDTFMLAAGGTGGHLFPAQALAEELTRREHDVVLITDQRGDLYDVKFPARQIFQVPAATLRSRSPVAVASTVWTLLRGMRAAYGILGRVRPRAVIGFGGYPSFAPLLAAKLRGVPTALHEQNAVMGRANRMLARWVSAVAASFPKTQLLSADARSRTTVTGNPVRDAVIAASNTPYVPPAAGGTLRLLVFGGSQGARYFSDLLPPALGALDPGLRGRIQVTQQCRAEDLERVGAAYRDLAITHEIAPFFNDLPDRIAAAHVVIARSGASTIAELSVIGRPSILVPLPHALDNDQLFNATRLADVGAAWCFRQSDLGGDRLAGELAGLLAAPHRLEEAAVAARQCGLPDAVQRLANLAESL